MQNKSNINFRDRKLVFMDFEMTGLDVDIHEIIEAGCLVVNGRTREVEREFYARVKPSHIETGDAEALKIAGFSTDKWRDARDPKDVFEEINGLAPDGIPAGWNVATDWKFLQAAFKKYGLKSNFDYHTVDIVGIAYAAFLRKKEPKGLKLRDVSRALGLNIPNAHDAMTDIRFTFEVYKKIMLK